MNMNELSINVHCIVQLSIQVVVGVKCVQVASTECLTALAAVRGVGVNPVTLPSDQALICVKGSG